MGACLSLPDRAVEQGRHAAEAVVAGLSTSLEASAAAAAKATRRAKLAKYALVKCEFDAETAEKARRLEIIRELLYEQHALWKSWAASTVAMDYSVLMHWSKHCHANDNCAKRLRTVALQVQNASAAHKEHVEYITGPFFDTIDEAIDSIEETWHVYEAYEKAEYAYRYATMTSRDEEKIVNKRAEMDNALKEAKKAIEDGSKKVEHNILVPLYQRAIGELDKYAKKCQEKRHSKNEEQEKAFAATFERANSVAYSKMKKRTYTAQEVAILAAKTVSGAGADLPGAFTTMNNATDEMKRHAISLTLSLQDFLPYISTIFGTNRHNDFADVLIKKVDGYKALKKAAAEFNDKIEALTGDIDVEEFKSLIEKLQQEMNCEFERISTDADHYVKSLKTITQAEKNLAAAETTYKKEAHKHVMAPVEAVALSKFNTAKAAWNAALKEARDAVFIATERSEAEFQAYAERFNNLFMNKDCIFATSILGVVEKVCAVVTDAQKKASTVQRRVISDQAEDPDPVEVIETEKTVDFVEAETSEQERLVAANETAEALRKKEEAEYKAKEAEEAAERARIAVEKEKNEKKKEELARKAQVEAAKAEAERKAKEEADALAAHAAAVLAEKEENAKKAQEKAIAELERQTSEADKVLESESKKRVRVMDALELNREKSLKECSVARASFKAKRVEDFEQFAEDIAQMKSKQVQEEMAAPETA